MYREFYRPFVGQDASGEVSDSGFVAVHCCLPTHKGGVDKNKSAGFKPDSGLYNCFGCGAFSAPRFLEAMGTDTKGAYQTVADYRTENKIGDEPLDTFVNYLNPSPRFQELAELAQRQIKPELEMVQDYMRSRGFEFETLTDLGIGFLYGDQTWDKWQRDSLVFPYYFDDKVVGIRYRDSNGQKGGEEGCHFTLWGIDTLDEPSVRAAIINEGESDRILAYQVAKKRGLTRCEGGRIVPGSKVAVVSSPTATFRQEWKREFQGVRKAALIPHDDEASKKMRRAFKGALPDKGQIFELPWKRKQYGNDFCDWSRYHTDDEMGDFLEQALGDVDRTILTGEEFAEVANKPRKWIIEGLIARRQVAMIAGKPKAFKTWIMLNLMKTLLVPGTHFLGIPELPSVIEDAKILVIEEEGDIEELYQRAALVLGDIPDWRKRTLWAHHLGIKLDEDDVVERLATTIKENGINILLIDPFQRMHTVDENSASELGIVWKNIHSLTGRFPDLTTWILHHFGKGGSIADGWDAFRGSSRSAGEVDLGMFVEKRPSSEPPGTKVKFDGRSIPRILGKDGKDIFKLKFNPLDGSLLVDDSGKRGGGAPSSKVDVFLTDLERQGTWLFAEAAVHYGISIQTLDNWIKKGQQQANIEKTRPSLGKPAYIKFNGWKGGIRTEILD